MNQSRIVVVGDSAGGTLAAACALRVRDEGGPRLCFQLLIYPATDCRMGTASMKKYTNSPLWNRSLNRKMWELYLRDGDSGTPDPLRTTAQDFKGQPIVKVPGNRTATNCDAT